MKKVIGLSLIFLIVICTMTTVYANTTGKVNLITAKNEYNKGDKIVVEVKLSDLKTTNGIIAFGATLKYDKNSLEYKKMEGKNGWVTPSYYSETGIFATDNADYVKKDGTVIEITFEVKNNSVKNIPIELTNIEVGDGSDKNGLFTMPDAKTTLKIKGGTTNTKPGTGDNNTGSTTNPSKDKSPTTTVTPDNKQDTDKKQTTSKLPVGDSIVSDKKLPQTGNNNFIILTLLGIAIISAIAFFVKIKILNKKVDNIK